MSNIKYQYAYDSKNNLVCIKDVTHENRQNESFYCLSCGAEFVAKLGEINEHHFAHKGGCELCSFESYLHKLAKKLIKKKFEKSDSFKVEFKQRNLCRISEECPFYNEDMCVSESYTQYDLKKYYNFCQEEAKIGKYRADLLLTDKTRKYNEPILIEIKVSHGCTEEKENSEFRIIEVPIESEGDIKDLYNRSIWYDGVAKFINFKVNKNKILKRLNVCRFVLTETGRIEIHNVLCNNKGKIFPNSKLELNIYTTTLNKYSNYGYGLAYIVNKGYDISTVEDCSLCMYDKSSQWSRISSLNSKEFHCEKKKPHYHSENFASFCKYYSIASHKLSHIVKDLQDVIVVEIE